MVYQLKYTGQFKKSVKLCKKRGLNIELLREVIDHLQKGDTLPQNYKAHKLLGNYSNCWECHIQPDWLLLWQENESDLTLMFINTGSHSDIF